MEGGGTVQAWKGFNPLYIYPGGHDFRVVDLLLTNFHLPDSSLIQLVAAFAGVMIGKGMLEKVTMKFIQTLVGVLLMAIALALGSGVL